MKPGLFLFGDNMITPLFVFGTSYRCGSTLVQRALNASPEVLIYGENNSLIPNCANDYANVFVNGGKQRAKEQYDAMLYKEDEWQANLGSSAAAILAGFGGYFQSRYLDGPTLSVMRDIDNLKYVGFKHLFARPRDIEFIKIWCPSAKVVFCHRNFKDSWNSLRKREWGKPWGTDTVFRMWLQSAECLGPEVYPKFDAVFDYDDPKPVATKLRVMYNNLGIDPPDNLQAIADKKIVDSKFQLERDAQKPEEDVIELDLLSHLTKG
jgi:hypothetical protein